MTIEELPVQKGYDLWADSYDSESNFLVDLESISTGPRDRAIELYLSNLKSVLDLGCGTGRHSEILAAKFKSYSGVDLSQEMIAQAKAKHPHLATHFEVGSVFDLSENRKFDFIHASLCLMHFEDLKLFFRKVSTLLKPDGIFYTVDANAQLLQAGSRPNFDRGDRNYEVRYFIHEASEIRNCLRAADLEIIDESVTYFQHPDILKLQKYERYRAMPCLRHLSVRKKEST